MIKLAKVNGMPSRNGIQFYFSNSSYFGSGECIAMRFEPERLWIEYETAYPEVIAKSDVVDLLKLDHYLKHGDFYFEVSRQGIVIKVFAQGTKRRPKLTITFPTINQSYESIYGALFAQ